MKYDIASVLATSKPYMHINHELAENKDEIDCNINTNFALKYWHLDNFLRENNTHHTFL